MNGYLAKSYDVADLAQGILWILENSERWTQLSESARQKVENNFTIQHQTKQYFSLFYNLLP